MKYNYTLKNLEKIAYVINNWKICISIALRVLLSKRNLRIYLYPIRKFSEIIILAVVKGDRVGIFLGKFASIEAFLKVRKSVKCADKITYENEDNNRFHRAIIQRSCQIIAEPSHTSVLRIVDRIVRVIRINPARTQRSVQPWSMSWNNICHLK